MMRRKTVKITELDYWLYHPTLKTWIGPYFSPVSAKKWAKNIAKTTGKAVEVYSEKAGTGARKAFAKLKAS
jgi:hypothetical protein